MPDNIQLTDDIVIIRQIQAGDINAFEILLTKYKTHVLKIVLRHLPPQHAEETVQDVFVKAFQSLSAFKGKSDFKYWLSGIAVRTCYDFWRKAYRSKEISFSSLTDKQQQWLEKMAADNSYKLFQQADKLEEAQEVLYYALSKLSAEDRMVIELVYLEELTLKEAAEMLGWSLANIKVRAFRSRKKLEKVLIKTLSHKKRNP